MKNGSHNEERTVRRRIRRWLVLTAFLAAGLGTAILLIPKTDSASTVYAQMEGGQAQPPAELESPAKDTVPPGQAAPQAVTERGLSIGGQLMDPLIHAVREVRVESPQELARMEEHVRAQVDRRDVRHAFQLPTGDEVDCVDIDKQPGMRRQEMRGQKVLPPPPPVVPPTAESAPMAPGAMPAPGGPATPPSGQILAAPQAFLDGGKDARGAARSCPPATIPIRRVTTDELKSFRNLRDFLRKYPEGSAAPSRDASPNTAPAFGSSDYHQYAHAARYNVTNYGAFSRLNIWNPKVQVSSEFSLSQIWVVRGSGNSLETLEAGVQVFPGKYGNSNARLFVYSTSDGYSGNSYLSGCYNLDCGRFVQTNPNIVIGGAFPNYSVPSGTQYEVEVGWWRVAGAWWLYVNGTPVGYYPLYLFDANGLQNYASTIDFGGEIIDDRTKHSYHTTTDMGSSTEYYASAGYGKAAYQRKIWYYSGPNTTAWATGLTPMKTNAYCYNVTTPTFSQSWGTYFYFNGPGYNTNCK